MFLRLLMTLCLAVALAFAAPALAQGETLETLMQELPAGSFNDRAQVVTRIGATGDPRAAPVLEALLEGELHQRDADGLFLRVTGGRGRETGIDVLTGESLGPVAARTTTAVRVNNALRRTIRASLGVLTLRDPNPARRLSAAESAFRSPDPEQLDSLAQALEVENDAQVIRSLRHAQAATILMTDAPVAERIAAVGVIAERSARDVIQTLAPHRNSQEPELAAAVADALTTAERIQAAWTQGQNIWFGVSLGSVLLLAAIGLAITFGVMGVINLAHGELIMLGAYTTYSVQLVLRAYAPDLMNYSLLIALPAAFLMAGAAGVAIERGVVRFLYGRPLETLLATWGVSLILQQAVRSIFGATNREVTSPTWMSGSFMFGEMTVTYARLSIVIFSLIVFAGLLLLMRYSRFGVQIRAVTQNRAMAANMGVRTGWVDALTFGLGAGIAGLAGVALTQIDNVSPNLGQSYIIDSFLVVVFGGAGNLWGTLAAAFSLGIINKFLEPWAGAVLAKIVILVFIILFIQKRPRGLFPQRGRAAEA